MIHDIFFSVFGKSYRYNNAQASHFYTSNSKHAAWFDNNCKNAKRDFFKCKRLFKTNPTVNSRHDFLRSRNQYAYTKKKYKHNVKQGNIFSSICKTNPKKFWKHLKKL